MNRFIPALLLPLLFLTACTGQNRIKREIEVSGLGVVIAQPDQFSFSVTISEEAPTTGEAKTSADGKIREVLTILKEGGVSDNDIKTTGLVLSDATRWDSDQRIQIPYARKVEQSLRIVLNDWSPDTDLGMELIDRLSAIEDIRIDNIIFSIEDREPLYILARERAYIKAESKARELAVLSGMTLAKPIAITEKNSPSYASGRAMSQSSNFVLSESSDSGGVSESALPGGEIRISYDIHTVFEMR